MKTVVTLAIEEYEALVQDQKDKQRLMDELEKDAEDRGFFVKKINHMWRKEGSSWIDGYEYVTEKNTLEIVSKDEVLAAAQKEIDRLSELCVEQGKEIFTLTEENEKLKGRGFLARLLNREG